MGGKHSKPKSQDESLDIEHATSSSSENSKSSEVKQENQPSNYNQPPENTNASPLGKTGDVIDTIDERAGNISYAQTSLSHWKSASASRQSMAKKITKNLLLAVVYGMESKEANEPVKDSDSIIQWDKKSQGPKKLFISHLYAKDLLLKSPEYLLHRGDVTDWAGRTFTNITAFEYALWAKDFKMLQMMLECIPKTPEGNEIRSQLLKQAEIIQAPIEDGGGLKYTHTYEVPAYTANGFLDPTQTRSITQERTENHFNLDLLLSDYSNFKHPSNIMTKEDYWIKFIGLKQRVLPIHLLQRICDNRHPFCNQYSSNWNNFHRSNQAVFKLDKSMYTNASKSSLFDSSLGTDFALISKPTSRTGSPEGVTLPSSEDVKRNLASMQNLHKVNSNETLKIVQQLSQPQHSAVPNP